MLKNDHEIPVQENIDDLSVLGYSFRLKPNHSIQVYDSTTGQLLSVEPDCIQDRRKDDDWDYYT